MRSKQWYVWNIYCLSDEENLLKAIRSIKLIVGIVRKGPERIQRPDSLEKRIFKWDWVKIEKVFRFFFSIANNNIIKGEDLSRSKQFVCSNRLLVWRNKQREREIDSIQLKTKWLLLEQEIFSFFFFIQNDCKFESFKTYRSNKTKTRSEFLRKLFEIIHNLHNPHNPILSYYHNSISFRAFARISKRFVFLQLVCLVSLVWFLSVSLVSLAQSSSNISVNTFLLWLFLPTFVFFF